MRCTQSFQSLAKSFNESFYLQFDLVFSFCFYFAISLILYNSQNKKKLHNYRRRCTDFNKCKPKCLFEQQTNVVRQTNKWFLANYILFTRIFGDTKTVQKFTTNNCTAALVDFSICKMMRRGKKREHIHIQSTGETLRELSSWCWHKHTYTHSRPYWA